MLSAKTFNYTKLTLYCNCVIVSQFILPVLIVIVVSPGVSNGFNLTSNRDSV